ncbi:AT-hook motif nuclear-localized protein 17 [Camellia lanceoleosa]|nr:AT-hook motif nuclear-localized protein 17 [Camellia lanceoleosa]
MKVAALEITVGSDVIDMMVQFGRRRRLGGTTIMSAFGSVFNVTLRNPISHALSLTLHGKFNIISITETFMGSSAPSSSSSANFCSSGGSCSFGITLVGQQGHVLGGVVSGNVTVANKVVLVVATFMNPSFHRLLSVDLVVHDGGDDHGNPKLSGAGHGGLWSLCL